MLVRQLASKPSAYLGFAALQHALEPYVIGRAEINEMMAEFAEDRADERFAAAWPVMQRQDGVPERERLYMAEVTSAGQISTYVVVSDCRLSAKSAVRAVAATGAAIEVVGDSIVPPDARARLALNFGGVQQLS